MRYLLCIVSFISALVVNAQADTVHLESVAVYGDPVYLFTAGTGLKELKLDQKEGSLSDLLEGQGNLYFKSYGHHQLSTISFRGTGASHTSTLWHGIPVNYPTLGLMDFSQWPVWMLGSVQLQPGSGSALYGSGAIGGTVLLDSDVHLDPGKTIATIRTDAGSFGYVATGADVQYGTKAFAGRTRAYASNIKNDFPYHYNGQELRQVNAGSNNLGIQQQLQWIKGNHRFLLDGMVTQNDRENQPTKGATSEDKLKTTNTRIAVSHHFEEEYFSINSTLALINYVSIYNGLDRTFSNQYSFLSSYWREIGSQTSIRFGVNTNLFTALADNYPDRFTDVQTSIFGSMTTKPLSFWRATLNLRQSLYKDNYPFTPSMSQTFRVLHENEHTLKIQQHLGMGFRFPTLNDLHWAPGGNPELKPEQSVSGEVGMSWTFEEEKFKTDLQINLFKTWSKDFIVWLPGNVFWSPSNFQQVNISGIEVSGHGEWNFDDVAIQLTGNYAFTRSINETSDNTRIQLPYVPIHNASAFWRTNWRTWQLQFSANVTGLRYTTLSNDLWQSVDAFTLINLMIEKDFRLGNIHFELGGSIKNLWDVDYENLINRAMPGRNYQIHLLIKI